MTPLVWRIEIGHVVNDVFHWLFSDGKHGESLFFLHIPLQDDCADAELEDVIVEEDLDWLKIIYFVSFESVQVHTH